MPGSTQEGGIRRYRAIAAVASSPPVVAAVLVTMASMREDWRGRWSAVRKAESSRPQGRIVDYQPPDRLRPPA